MATYKTFQVGKVIYNGSMLLCFFSVTQAFIISTGIWQAEPPTLFTLIFLFSTTLKAFNKLKKKQEKNVRQVFGTIF